MERFFRAVTLLIVMLPLPGLAQYRTTGAPTTEAAAEMATDADTAEMATDADTAQAQVIITLDQALEIALSENISVKIADKEVERTGYARKGTYASLFPQIDITGAYQRTIARQVMYMDFDMSSLIPGMGDGTDGEGTDGSGDSSLGDMSNDGLEVGRLNTWSAGLTASMPLVNAQLWKSIKISGLSLELAVEQARESRIEMVSQVKNAYYAVLLAKEAFDVYKEVYENAVMNCAETQKRYDAEKATEQELLRAQTTVANAIPDVYNAESSIILALWQLKAVMGIDLDTSLDVAGSLDDYAGQMFHDIHSTDSLSLQDNSTMRQLAIQAEQLAENIRLQKFAYIPSLAASFSYNLNAMTNDFNFSEYRWTPYSYVGVSLQIPIFSGGKRYNDVRQARNNYEQLQLQTLDVERQLKIAIRQSLTTMETNMKSYYAAGNAVKAAQKGYSIAEKAYQVGRLTLMELNDAQLALTQARLAESSAVYNFLVAKTQLEQTLGKDFTAE